MRAVLVALAMIAVGLSGCFGFDPATGGYDYKPGADWEPTGKTVHLEATVADWVMHEVYPGFHANLWAFCFRAKDPADQYSVDAIEYWNELETDGELALDANTGAPAVGSGWEGKCSVPGPTIRVQQGDKVIVEFAHQHFHCHTIHWHGQYVPWQSDGAPGVNQESVCAGDSFTYEFVAARAGSLWYHCHVDTHFHVMQGLFGAIIVEPQETKWEPKDIDREYLFVYSTLNRELVQVTKARIDDPHKDHKHSPGSCGASGVQGCQNPPVDVTPDTWMLNGRAMPNTMMDNKSILRVNEGERIKLRLYNVGETVETIHTHGHDMLVTHIDGNPLHPNARYYVDTLTIGPANRYDVVIDAEQPGLWMMHTHVDGHVTNDHMAPGGGMSIIAYESVEEEMGGLRPFADGAELAGGRPWVEPLVIPADQMYMTERRSGASLTAASPVDETWSFPVDLMCAAKVIRVTAEATADLSPLQPQIDLSMAIVDGDANAVATIELEGGEGELYLSPVFDSVTGALLHTGGDWTVKLTGTAPPADLVLTAVIDYAADEDGLYDGRITAGTPCDPLQRVFDPIAYLNAR